MLDTWGDSKFHDTAETCEEQSLGFVSPSKKCGRCAYKLSHAMHSAATCYLSPTYLIKRDQILTSRHLDIFYLLRRCETLLSQKTRIDPQHDEIHSSPLPFCLLCSLARYSSDHNCIRDAGFDGICIQDDSILLP